jgi:hypothetical protein
MFALIQPKIIVKLQEEERKLQEKIIEELESFGDYENDLYHKNNEINCEDYD